MTREEAIKILDNLNPTKRYDSNDAYYIGQALTMAIQALEQEPSETIHGSTYGGVSWGGTYKPQEPCSDVISSIGGAKICSICQAHMGLSSFKYCPNCGARMESEVRE